MPERVSNDDDLAPVGGAPSALTSSQSVHCWHNVTTREQGTRNPPQTYQCCECGAKGRFVWDRLVPSGHGPFYPNPGAYVFKELISPPVSETAEGA